MKAKPTTNTTATIVVAMEQTPRFTRSIFSSSQQMPIPPLSEIHMERCWLVVATRLYKMAAVHLSFFNDLRHTPYLIQLASTSPLLELLKNTTTSPRLLQSVKLLSQSQLSKYMTKTPSSSCQGVDAFVSKTPPRNNNTPHTDSSPSWPQMQQQSL
jgi:hypothetical protein